MKKKSRLPIIIEKDANLFVICKDLKNPSKRLLNGLRYLKGMKTPPGEGYELTEAIYSAVAYFFQNIYGRIEGETFKRYKATPEDFTIEKIKSFFDNSSIPTLQPVHRIVSEYKELHNAEFFDECYFVIQVAYFFATTFGAHQYIDYIKRYQATKEKLPEDLYKYDIDVLHKKYAQIDEGKADINTEIKLWYYSVLDIMLNELNISNPYYTKEIKEGDGRYYNPLALTARTLRKCQPFKMALVDISAAYPTAIDNFVGSNVAPTIYENISKALNISRAEAKIYFNKKLNSGAYRTTEPQLEEFIRFLLKCGYSFEQMEKIVFELTDNPTRSFYQFAVQVERKLMEQYKENNIQARGATRVHDAFYFCLHNNVDYSKIQLKLNGYTFNFETINEVDKNYEFLNSNRFLKKSSFAFMPKNLRLAYHKTITKASDSIGHFNDFIEVEATDKTTKTKNKKSIFLDVEFFREPEIYKTANFKTLNRDFTPCINTLNDLFATYYKSLSLVQRLNPDSLVTTKENLRDIFWHHRKYSNLCFDVETMVSYFELSEMEGELPETKQRDFKFYNDIDTTEGDYLIFSAIVKARKIVKSKTKVKEFIFDIDAFLKCNKPFELFKYDDEFKMLAKQWNVCIYGLSHLKSDKKELKKDVLYKLSYNTQNLSLKLSLSLKNTKHKTRQEAIKKKLQALEHQLKEQQQKEKEIEQTLQDLQNGIIPKIFEGTKSEAILKYYFVNAQEQPQFKTNQEQPLPEQMRGAFFDTLRDRIQKAKESKETGSTARAYSWLFCNDEDIEKTQREKTNPKRALANISAKNIIKANNADDEYQKLFEWYRHEADFLKQWPEQYAAPLKKELLRIFLNRTPYNPAVMKAAYIKRLHPQKFAEVFRENQMLSI